MNNDTSHVSRRSILRGAAAIGAGLLGASLRPKNADARSLSVVATDLQDATGNVNVSAAAAPAAGALLTASSASAASWVFPGIAKQWDLDYPPNTAAFFSSDRVIFPFTNQDGSTYSGTFVAKADGNAMIYAYANAGIAGNAYARMMLFVSGANQSAPLYDAHGDPVSGATVYEMGQAAVDAGGTGIAVQYLSGLTPGATYTWQMCGVLVGTTYANPVANTPKGVALRNKVSGHADKGYAACAGAGSGGAQVVPFLLGGRGYGNIGQANEDPGIAADQLPGTFQPYGSTFGSAVPSTTLSSPSAVAFTPDGTKAVAVGSGNNVINVVDADTDTLLHSWTVTGASGFTSVVCDNSSAYVVDSSGGRVYKVTLSTGAKAATSAAMSGPQLIGINPALTLLAVPTSVGTVLVLNTSNLTTFHTVSLVGLSGGGGTIGSSTVVRSARVTPDGLNIWAVLDTSPSATLVWINSSFVATAYSLPHTAPAGSDLAIAPTGTNALVVFGGGSAAQVWTSGSYRGSVYADLGAVWSAASSVVMTNDGHAYVATGSDGQVWEYSGATFFVSIAGFNGGACSVLVDGAQS